MLRAYTPGSMLGGYTQGLYPGASLKGLAQGPCSLCLGTGFKRILRAGALEGLLYGYCPEGTCLGW